eukprot:scaffold394485_cov32-Prasinocladus_malaysianus.AAC.1
MFENAPKPQQNKERDKPSRHLMLWNHECLGSTHSDLLNKATIYMLPLFYQERISFDDGIHVCLKDKT